MGLDEAGRGPVLGPLVIAAVTTDNPDICKQLGCVDSKKLTPKKREQLFQLLQQHPQINIHFQVITPAQLNIEMQTQTLNQIEITGFTTLINIHKPTQAIIDAAHPNAETFAKLIKDQAPGNYQLISEHKADDNHPIVAAASIAAKVKRDALMQAEQKNHQEPIGSGYPSDPKTKQFLTNYYTQHKKLPESARQQWKTCQRLITGKI